MSGFLFILIICVGVAGFAGYNMLKLREIIDFLRGNHTDILLHAQELMGNIQISANSVTEIARGAQNADELVALYDSAKESAFARLKNISNLTSDPYLKTAASLRAFVDTTETNMFELFDNADRYLDRPENTEFSTASLTSMIAIVREKEMEINAKCRSLSEALSSHSKLVTKRSTDTMFDIMGYIVKLFPVILIAFAIGFS